MAASIKREKVEPPRRYSALPKSTCMAKVKRASSSDDEPVIILVTLLYSITTVLQSGDCVFSS
jgi:hypothetical protein